MIGRIRPSFAYAASVLALVLTVAGCSSSDNSGDDGSSSAAISGGALDAATKATISKNFKLFFDTDTPLGPSVKVLQHGEVFRKTLIKESNSPSAVDITIKISDIKSQRAKVAVVTFTIYSGKQALLPNTHGFAVRDGGTWKVAAQTFCALLKLEGTAPPACKKPSITSLPR